MLVKQVRIVSATTGEELVLPSNSFGPQGWCLGPNGDGNMEGWWEAPAPRAEAVNRPLTSGAFAPVSLFTGPRVLTLVAHHSESTPADERKAREQLSAIATGWLRIIVEEADRTSHVYGFLSAQMTTDHIDDSFSTHSLIITCPDPLKYSGPGGQDGDLSAWEKATGRWANAASGGLLFPLAGQEERDDVASTSEATMRFTEAGLSNSLACVNTGTASTWPVLEVVGPVSWARWEHDNQVVLWQGTVPAGRLLQLNSQTGSARLGGIRVGTSSLVRDEFFQLAPGTTNVSISADRPAQFRVRWLSAWT